MWKIESQFGCPAAQLSLSGRIQADDTAGIQAALKRCSRVKVLNLEDVTLVDVAAVRFLSAIERGGIQLLNCPPYVREWIVREHTESERGTTPPERPPKTVQ
jgi:hypothetical protein